MENTAQESARIEYINQDRIRKESWKFYFAAAAWPLYLFLLPLVLDKIGIFALLVMVFPGAYLFTWVGFLMHETWHKYVPNVPNGLLYKLFSWMLLTDPQVYRMVHGGHHMNVNTWEDTEFHPFGLIRNPALRRVYNILEIVFGTAFIVIASSARIPRLAQFRGKYRFGRFLFSVMAWIIFFGGIGYLSHSAFKVPAGKVVLAYVCGLWIASVTLHFSQLAEHGNLIVPGAWEERNIKTRNMKSDGLAEKILLFLTHGDSREHVLHHTKVAVYSRPFPGKVPMPENPVYISFKDFLHILWVMAVS